MTDYYVEPAVGNDGNAGTSWGAGNSWATIQKAFDTAVAADTVYCKGTETLAATVDVDTNSGAAGTGWIKFIGVNGSGTNDGTRYIVDVNSAAADGFLINEDYIWWENIEVKNSTGDGWDCDDYALQHVYINCCANNNGGNGWDCWKLRHATFIRCVAYSNTGSGIDDPYQACVFLWCRSRDNSDSGLYAYAYSTSSNVCFIGCIFDHNSDDGADNVRGDPTFFNCVFDNNTDDGIYINAGADLVRIIGCRITNHDGADDNGVKYSNRTAMHGWNYFQNNTTNEADTTNTQEILYDGATTDLADQGDTESGYTDEDDPEDYNLASDATLRRTAITIPLS